MKATADAVQVQAQNSITLAQIWEPQMQHHELQKCRTEHAAGRRPLVFVRGKRKRRWRHVGDEATPDPGSREPTAAAAAPPRGGTSQWRRRPSLGSRESAAAAPAPGEPRDNDGNAAPWGATNWLQRRPA